MEFPDFQEATRRDIRQRRAHDRWAYKRFKDKVQQELTRRVKMQNRVESSFTACGETLVWYTLYLDLKERFEGVEE